MRDTTSNQNNQKKPTYKDYQAFLQNYDSNGVSISPASSSSSLQSNENEINAPKAYNEYLQSYGTKKFGSVRMKNSIGKDEMDTSINTTHNKKTIRSELVINITPCEDSNGSLKVTSAPSPKLVTPITADNSTVSDDMIHAKTAVLEELLTKSPTLKKPPPNRFKTNNPKSIYHKLEQFTSSEKDKPIPPPLPNNKPTLLRRNSSNGILKTPPSPKPPVPLKTFLKTEDLQCSKEDQLIKQMESMVNKSINIPPLPPKLLQQLSPGNTNANIPNTTTVIPVPDTNVDVDKNDPNVKKLVYNTYRGMLGAYNNKANNMVSTLPRNFVVQDKGVSKQVESIASQGCLGNLNGRINPNPED